MKRTVTFNACMGLGQFLMASALYAQTGSDTQSGLTSPIAGMIFVLVIIAMNLFAAYKKEKAKADLIMNFIR